MATNIVEKIYEDFNELISYLENSNEISLKNEADNNFKKVLILTIASYFERQIIEMLLNFIGRKSNNDTITVSIIKNRVIYCQYHTFFDWERKNANKFFSMLGEDFKKEAEENVNNDIKLDEGIKAFLEIGKLRNELVHRNFGSYTIDKTAKDVVELYYKALSFIEFLSKKFN